MTERELLNINIEDYKRISKRYREGERNGKGKEYDYDGILLFEGNYFFNKRWEGMGRQYNKDGKILSVVFYNEGKKVKDLKIFK